ncbi:hypothetical protein, partial [Paraburkholderia caledonica]|uniref:hypothetical protein n=1 Tax=Paraburkholderia caledonica TaxID=134536 RepID=UPI003CBC5B62
MRPVPCSVTRAPKRGLPVQADLPFTSDEYEAGAGGVFAFAGPFPTPFPGSFAAFERTDSATLSASEAAIENANVLTPFALCTDTLPR